MNKYEAMFIVRPELSEDDRKNVTGQLKDIAVKNGCTVNTLDLWSDRRRLTFEIKKQQEGLYYIMNFTAPSDAIGKLKYAYGLHESLLRCMITRLEQ
jgi:small subunit ribosomal protein S6